MIKVYQITEDVDHKKVSEFAEGFELIYKPCKTQDDIIKNCSDAVVLISLYEPIDRRVIDALTDLKYICVASIGYNAVDVEYAKSRGILVSNNPSYCIEEVADYTLALMLNCVRKINAYHKSVQEEGEWDYTKFGNTLRRMSNLTVSLIGFGSIARKVNERLRGFGCKVNVYDPYISDEMAEANAVEKVDLNVIREKADIISIHVPLLDSTRKMINETFLTGLGKTPIIVNCSRGEIIDEQALLRALDKGQIRAAALDVLESEDPDSAYLKDLTHPNLLITPHVAFYSREAIEECDTNVGKFVSAFVNERQGEIPLL